MAENMRTPSHRYDRPIRPVLSRALSIVFVLALIIMTIVALIPSQPSDAPIYADKILHCASFAVLTGLALVARPRLRLMTLTAGLTLYGAGIEFLQGVMPFGRTASVLDLLANVAGTGFLVMLWVIWVHVRKTRPSTIA